MGIGSIRADEILPLEEFKTRTGLSRHSMRGLREAGLPIRRIGKRGFILGSDFLEMMSRVEPNKRIPCGEVPQ